MPTWRFKFLQFRFAAARYELSIHDANDALAVISQG